ncbi:HNH endonuclease [Accumulibacter sp.]|uniref:HNH endonuclease n=1 Tax=Accumulibacter sp. TaxID=2053492 RepID=UPI002C788AB8|nr:HNH endonuclease [Accumulibacter sp.]HNB69181.1 HNH endonuclease [Accumulibacter sp.]HNC22200.1 HNH endonuclease [Accumulibacter sp.]
MPIAAARPCRHPGCGQLVRDGSGYCLAHESERKVGTFSDPNRGSRHQRGYGSRWDVARKRILERDAGLCQVCLSNGQVTVATQVDHIIPKCNGGEDGDDNLQAICKPCHQAKTASESRQAKR